MTPEEVAMHLTKALIERQNPLVIPTGKDAERLPEHATTIGECYARIYRAVRAVRPGQGKHSA